MRILSGENQTEFCKIIGISKSYLSEIESGKKQASMSVLSLYAKEFEMPLSTLIKMFEASENYVEWCDAKEKALKEFIKSLSSG